MNRVARTQPVKRSKSGSLLGLSFARVFLAVFLLVLCLGLAAAGLALIELPAMAAREFGPPAAGLGFSQRLLYSYRLISNRGSLLTPLEPGAGTRAFNVSLGESVNAIAARLEEERLIANADAFRTFLIYAGLDTGVQAGKYQLGPGMTTVEIARALQDPLPGAVAFNILPGWRLEELAESLTVSGIEVSPVDFVRLVKDPPAALLPAGVERLDSLEGFLMPGSYVVERTISLEDLVRMFIQRFNESVNQDLRAGFANHGLTLEEAVILASMVQRESVVLEEQPVIASVFYNRLANGMRLESDPTVQYALGYQQASKTWWKNPLSSADLTVDSGYNTYRVMGLPSGPIANPGLPALQAVANPSDTHYFYFRAVCDGSGKHAFAVTYDEHLNNACR